MRGAIFSRPAKYDLEHNLKRFHNYCGLGKIARCGFPREKTTYTSLLWSIPIVKPL
jgi:hypothetical protein